MLCSEIPFHASDIQYISLNADGYASAYNPCLCAGMHTAGTCNLCGLWGDLFTQVESMWDLLILGPPQVADGKMDCWTLNVLEG